MQISCLILKALRVFLSLALSCLRAPRASTPLLVSALLCGLWTGLAHADKADRFAPINFAADSARVDDNSRTNVLKGNVELTKGTIVLKAAQVEVRQLSDGAQNAVATGGEGGRSYFRQRREGLDEFIEGQSERIEYDGKADQVRFIGKAVMRRLRGATVADEVTGQTIVYDNRTEVFQVVGRSGGTTTGGPGASSGRVRGTIAPRKDAPVMPGGKADGDQSLAPQGGASLASTTSLSATDNQRGQP
jgi:lipopolysaccharide export system protein LptA